MFRRDPFKQTQLALTIIEKALAQVRDCCGHPTSTRPACAAGGASRSAPAACSAACNCPWKGTHRRSLCPLQVGASLEDVTRTRLFVRNLARDGEAISRAHGNVRGCGRGGLCACSRAHVCVQGLVLAFA